MFEKSANSLYQHDKILNFIYTKIFKKFGGPKSFLLLYVIPLMGTIIVGYFEGTLFNHTEIINNEKIKVIGVLEDYTNYVLPMVVIISVFLLYKFHNFIYSFLLYDLKMIINNKKMDNVSIISIDNYLTKMFTPKGRFKIFKFALITTFIILWGLNALRGFNPVKYYGFDIWHSWYHPAGFIYLKLYNLIYTAIILSIFFYYFIINLYGFSMVFRRISKKDGFLIKPLFPDKSGGLKVLSNLSMYFMYMVLPFFIIYLSLILRGTNFLPVHQISMFALIVLLFVTFFLPLSTVHSAMKRAKNKELEYIGERFSKLTESIKNDLENKLNDPKFKNEVEALEKLDYLYVKINSMPVWPFDFLSIRRFFAATLLPILIFLIEQLTNPNSIIYNLDKIKEFFIR